MPVSARELNEIELAEDVESPAEAVARSPAKEGVGAGQESTMGAVTASELLGSELAEGVEPPPGATAPATGSDVEAGVEEDGKLPGTDGRPGAGVAPERGVLKRPEPLHLPLHPAHGSASPVVTATGGKRSPRRRRAERPRRLARRAQRLTRAS